MNSVPVRPASLSERAAYHEAGHATAAMAYGIPIIRVTIKNETPHLLRGHYRAQHDAGLECMATPASGPALRAAADCRRDCPPPRRRRAVGADGMGRATHSVSRR